ncbi:GTP binding protein 1 [Trichuris trichiura]|uniref:GTP binding protein 1 n=1 Tax=Trichuris trichiura TaxID=36087 RepID=A0A077ZIE3_TRITR|nr:GTP binding protein 1 [Trichuris trichiura]
MHSMHFCRGISLLPLVSFACTFETVLYRVAVVGNVDAGKSTLLSVLTHGQLDNGRGFARVRIFRHQHEVESGRTSSIGNDILGFDCKGHVVNKYDTHGSNLEWAQICTDSAKVITFIDLAGHEKYLKTTIFGMTGHRPDYCMLLIGGNAGTVGMAKEHLGLALALNLPVFVVVTKIDMCPSNVLERSVKMLTRLLKSPGCRKFPIMVQSPSDAVLSAYNFPSERICPIFLISNVTGERLDLLKTFLNLLIAHGTPREDLPPEFQIDEVYNVNGVGTVVSGMCLKGILRQNDTVLLGPDITGSFSLIRIKSIHRKRMPVVEVHAGHSASCWLHKVKWTSVRKGMMLLSPSVEPNVCWEFEADVLVLHHPTTIGVRYQAMLHCGSVRQTVKIVEMSKDFMRTGDKAQVRFRFLKNPEYLCPGQRLIFREGRTKAVGTITKTFGKLSTTNTKTRRKMHALTSIHFSVLKNLLFRSRGSSES